MKTIALLAISSLSLMQIATAHADCALDSYVSVIQQGANSHIGSPSAAMGCQSNSKTAISNIDPTNPNNAPRAITLKPVDSGTQPTAPVVITTVTQPVTTEQPVTSPPPAVINTPPSQPILPPPTIAIIPPTQTVVPPVQPVTLPPPAVINTPPSQPVITLPPQAVIDTPPGQPVVMQPITLPPQAPMNTPPSQPTRPANETRDEQKTEQSHDK